MFGLGIPEVILFLIFLFVLFLPTYLVVKSDRVSGSDRTIWIVATLFFGWLAFLIFLVSNPKKQDVIE